MIPPGNFFTRSPKDELYEYCYQVKRTILEVLADFRHVKIPRDYIFDVFPPLRPREFSIASSIKVSSSDFFCVSIKSDD